MSQVPAIRYPLYISAFEKIVSEAQKKIDGVRGLELGYNACREAMQKYLPNRGKLILQSDQIHMNVIIDKNDYLDDIIAIVHKIGEDLLKSNVLWAGSSGVPAERSTYCIDKAYTWRMKTPDHSILFNIDVPFTGTRDYKVDRIEIEVPATTKVDYVLVQRKLDFISPRADRPFIDEANELDELL